MYSFHFSFTIFNRYFLKSTKKQFGILTVLGISQKQLKRLIFIENMLIGVLSIFLAFNLDLSFHSSFISYRQDYTCTWLIFILAYKRHYFNYHHLSRTLYSRIIFYTDAHSYEKSCTSFKRRNKTKKRKASVLISLFGAICLISGYALAANPLYFLSLGDIIDFYMPSLVYLSSHRLLQLERIFLLAN